MESFLPSLPEPMEPYRLNVADALGIRMQDATEALVRPWATAVTSMNVVDFSSYLDPAVVLAAKATSVSLVPRYTDQVRGIHDLYAGVSVASTAMKEMSGAAGLMPSELTGASELAARINTGLYSPPFSGMSHHFAAVLGSPLPSTHLWGSLASSEMMKTAGLASSHLYGTQRIAEALKPVASAQVSALWEAAAGIASKAVRDTVLSDDVFEASRRKLEFFGSPSPVVAVDLLKTAPEIEDFVERVRETYPEEVEEVEEVWRLFTI